MLQQDSLPARLLQAAILRSERRLTMRLKPSGLMSWVSWLSNRHVQTTAQSPQAVCLHGTQLKPQKKRLPQPRCTELSVHLGYLG